MAKICGAIAPLAPYAGPGWPQRVAMISMAKRLNLENVSRLFIFNLRRIDGL